VANDDEIELGEEPQFELVCDEGGKPLVGEEVVEVVKVDPPRHTPYGPRDVRAYAHLRVQRTMQPVLKVWCMVCGGCGLGPGAVCAKPRLKKGISGFLRRDIEIALGRRATPKEPVSFRRLFVGRLFRTVVEPVTRNSNGKPLPKWSWYSKAGEFIFQEDKPGDPDTKNRNLRLRRNP